MTRTHDVEIQVFAARFYPLHYVIGGHRIAQIEGTMLYGVVEAQMYAAFLGQSVRNVDYDTKNIRRPILKRLNNEVSVLLESIISSTQVFQ